jgi:hypothetical protein
MAAFTFFNQIINSAKGGFLICDPSHISSNAKVWAAKSAHSELDGLKPIFS